MFYSAFADPQFLENKNQLIELKNKLSDSHYKLNNPDIEPESISLTDEQIKNPVEDFNTDIFKTPPGLDASAAPAVNNPDAPASLDNIKIGGNLDKLMGFGTQSYQALSTTSAGEGQSVANALNLTAQGANAGMAVAGPYGAAIGAGAGLLIGAIDGFSDAGKRGRMQRQANAKKFEIEKNNREAEYRRKDGLEANHRLKQLQEEQMKYL